LYWFESLDRILQEIFMKTKLQLTTILVILAITLIPLTAGAQDKLAVSVTTSTTCDQVGFTIGVDGGSAPYTLLLSFGDEEAYQVDESNATSIQASHSYPAHGEWSWNVTVQDGNGLTGQATGTIELAGPEVSLSSTPFPPMLTLSEGQASIEFKASATGGTEPYSFTWDLDGDGLADAGLDRDSASQTYSEAGHYEATVSVSDACGFTGSATLAILVIDPVDEDSCHPTAQKISEAVNSIFPDQAEQMYNCQDIFDIFEGALTGNQLGFGRMWHAYQLSQKIDELTWEEILGWHLNNSGWGALTQINRFAELLDSHSMRDLFEMVMSGEQSVGDLRTAVRAVTRFEADLEDALQRINDGANPGELGQFYKLASEMDLEPEALDEYLAEGMTLQELRHASSFADRVGAEWTEIVDAKAFDHSWGEIGQAYRLADETTTAADILAMGVHEFRQAEREAARSEREAEHEAREEERDQRTAARIAEQYGVDVSELGPLYEQCEGSWGCVRKALKDQTSTAGSADREARTAAQIASKYGVSQAEVMQTFENTCGYDWNCVRAYYRELAKEGRGKPDK
jgi:PKD repeat protein